MATHDCSFCLRETIQGATEVVGNNLVLPDSACTSPPFLHHNWVRKAQLPVPGNYPMLRFSFCFFCFWFLIFFFGSIFVSFWWFNFLSLIDRCSDWWDCGWSRWLNFLWAILNFVLWFVNFFLYSKLAQHIRPLPENAAGMNWIGF